MIVLGRIVAPYGVHGWVKVRPFGDDPDAWGAMPQWWLAPDAESSHWMPFEVEAFRSHGSSWVAKFRGIDDRDGAERIDGNFVAASRDALPNTRRDEYYWDDLIGLAVVNEQDQLLGKVVSLLETGAHQVLVVRNDEAERLLPFVADVVKEVDVGAGVIRVSWGVDW
jgi:16S rRNA processing protein RimM